MSFRYGYTWSYMVRTADGVAGSGFDVDGNPVASTNVVTPFLCDAQTDGGSMSMLENGEQLQSSYFVSIPVNSGLTFKRGDIVKDHNGDERRVVNFIVTKLARELWVT